jgi:hypothetical protein
MDQTGQLLLTFMQEHIMVRFIYPMPYRLQAILRTNVCHGIETTMSTTKNRNIIEEDVKHSIIK